MSSTGSLRRRLTHDLKRRCQERRRHGLLTSFNLSTVIVFEQRWVVDSGNDVAIIEVGLDGLYGSVVAERRQGGRE